MNITELVTVSFMFSMLKKMIFLLKVISEKLKVYFMPFEPVNFFNQTAVICKRLLDIMNLVAAFLPAIRCLDIIKSSLYKVVNKVVAKCGNHKIG